MYCDCSHSSLGRHLSALPAFNLVISLSKLTCQWRLNTSQGSCDVYYGLLQQPLLSGVEESTALWLLAGPRILMQNADCVFSSLVTVYSSLNPMPSSSYAERRRSPLCFLISIQAQEALMYLLYPMLESGLSFLKLPKLSASTQSPNTLFLYLFNYHLSQWQRSYFFCDLREVFDRSFKTWMKIWGPRVRD